MPLLPPPTLRPFLLSPGTAPVACRTHAVPGALGQGTHTDCLKERKKENANGVAYGTGSAKADLHPQGGSRGMTSAEQDP